MGHESKVKTQTRKPVKGNAEEYLCDLEISKGFLDWRSKVVAIIEKKLIGLYKNYKLTPIKKQY